MPQTSNLKEKEQLKNEFINGIGLKKKTFPPKIDMSPKWLRKKERPERYFMLGFITSFTGIIPSAGLPSLFDLFPAETPLYFVALYYAFFVLWILFNVYSAVKIRSRTKNS